MLGAKDLVIGTSYVLGSYSLTEDEIREFARVWDPQAQHLDPNPTHQAVFGGVIASGIQSLAVLQRLSVETLYSQWRVIAGRDLRDVVFLAPVRPDEVLSGTARIDRIVVDERRSRGDVAIYMELTAASRPVLRVTVDVVLEA